MRPLALISRTAGGKHRCCVVVSMEKKKHQTIRRHRRVFRLLCVRVCGCSNLADHVGTVNLLLPLSSLLRPRSYASIITAYMATHISGHRSVRPSVSHSIRLQCHTLGLCSHRLNACVDHDKACGDP